MLDNNDFENKAWDNMLELLDKELPEKRAFPWFRFSLVLLLLLLVGTGIGLYSYHGADHTDDNTSLSSTTLFATNQSSEHNTRSTLNTPNDHNELKESTHYSTNNKEEQTLSTSKNLKTNSVSYRTNVENELTGHYANNYTNLEINSTDITSDNTYPVDDHSEISQASNSDVFNDLALVAVVTQDIASINPSSSISSDFLSKNTAIESLEWTPDTEALKNISAENVLPLIPTSASRRVDYYAYAESNYVSDFKSLGIKLGAMVELGAQNSPWSVSSGLLYETNSLKRLESLDNADRIEESILPDTFNVPVENTPLKIEDASALLSVSYLNIPLQFHYRMNKFKLGVGIQNRFLVRQRLRSGVATSDLFQGANNNQLDYDRSGINRFHFSANQSLVYRIHPKIDIGFAFQYDLTGIFSANSFTTSNLNSANRLDNIGLSVAYKLN